MNLQTSCGGATSSLCIYRVSPWVGGDGTCLQRNLCSVSVHGSLICGSCYNLIPVWCLTPTLSSVHVHTTRKQHANRKQMQTDDEVTNNKYYYIQYLKGLESKEWGLVTWTAAVAMPCPSLSIFHLSHLNALHCLVDGLEQSPVLRVLVAVLVSEHVGQCVHVAIKGLLRQWLLLNTHKFYVRTSTIQTPNHKARGCTTKEA